eukprot:94315_1
MQRFGKALVGTAACGGIGYYCYTSLFTKKQDLKHDRSKALLSQHAEIWDLMKLSNNAKNELQDTVFNVHTAIQNNYKNNSSFMNQFKSPNRINHEDITQNKFIENHRKRFNMLGLTNDTKNELIKSANWTWNVLYDTMDTNVTEEDTQRANQIKQMMIKLNGPPPCCDDNIFLKAQPPSNV